LGCYAGCCTAGWCFINFEFIQEVKEKNKMKTGKLFWGFFLLTLGALFLLTKYDIIQSSFGFVWDVWPLIFVFWGAAVIFKNSLVKPVVSSLFGIFVALLLFGIIDNTFWDCDISDINGDYTEAYSEDYTSAIKSAELELNSGAGSFIIKNTTEKLIDGKGKGSFGEYDFESWKDDDHATIRFNLHKKNVNFFRGRLKNQLELALNPNPVWELNFNLGASKSNFDFSQYKVKEITIHTGATSSKVRLGDKYDSTNVYIDMGAASIVIEIPKTSACSINGDMALVSRDFPGFTKKNSGYYETENFNTSNKKVFVRVNGGVSSIKVERY
jgi:hypothetical protein